VSGPLSGIKVIELARVLAGPYCGMMLADLGADVIKVERPGQGDDLRHWGPPFLGDGQSTYFMSVNRNKRSIAVDLKSPAGSRVFRQLVARCDVLIENFRPGGLEALGLDDGTLRSANPGLIHCSITAYGTVGPMRDRPGYDVMVQAMSGLMSVTGEPGGEPMKVGVAIVDIAAGLNAAIGILAALVERSRTGRGDHIATSLLEVAVASLPNLTAGYLMAGAVPERLGNSHPNAIPYGVYPTRDSHIVLAVGNDEQWRRLCHAMGQDGLATHPAWASNGVRIARRAEVDSTVAGWFRSWTSAELADLLTRHEVPNGRINSIPDVLRHPQLAAVGLIRTTTHPTVGTLRYVGPPLHRSGEAPTEPPPLLDQHRSDILRDLLGLSPTQVMHLERAGAFGTATRKGARGEPAQATDL
jgi:glutaryl-CoA transferase